MNMSRVASVFFIVLVRLSAPVDADCSQAGLSDCDSKKPAITDLVQKSAFCSKAKEFAECVSAVTCTCTSGTEFYREYLTQVGLVNANEYACTSITDADISSLFRCLLMHKTEIEACTKVSQKLQDSTVDGCRVYESSVNCVRDTITGCDSKAPAHKVSTFFAKSFHPLASAVFGCVLDPGYKETDLPSIDGNCIRRNATRTAKSKVYNSSAEVTPSTTTTTAVAPVMYNSCWNTVVVFIAYVLFYTK